MIRQWVCISRQRLGSLSMRTGFCVLGTAVLFYVASFAQMLLPISLTTKGVLWIVLFGMAKAAQYSGLLIVGKEGIKLLRRRVQRNKK